MMKKTTKKRDVPTLEEGGVGARLRAFRRARELSVAELALKAGVSSGMVSQIERGITNPSLRTIARICAALEIPLMALLEETPERSNPLGMTNEPAFVRKTQSRPSFKVGPNGLTKQLLSPSSAMDGLQVMIITVPPHVSSEEVLIGAGEKAGIVLRGKARLVVDGVAAILSEGDSFQFMSTVPHSLHNDGPEEAEVLWIMSMQTPVKQL